MPTPPEAQPDLDPLIVTAPAIRSGTTLVQRLLCSSPNTLIYGEAVGGDLVFFLNLHATRALVVGADAPTQSRLLDEVLAGNVDNWVADLLPDPAGYVRALGES